MDQAESGTDQAEAAMEQAKVAVDQMEGMANEGPKWDRHMKATLSFPKC
jgi:hypothetical protein